MRLVAEQRGPPFRVRSRDRIRGHVDRPSGHPERRREGVRDLVPGENVIRRDVECLADVGADMLGGIRHPVHDGVKFKIFYGVPNGPW